MYFVTADSVNVSERATSLFFSQNIIRKRGKSVLGPMAIPFAS